MRISVLALSILFFCGCAKPGYFGNRLNDGADVLTLTGGFGVGAKVSVGPVCFNSLMIQHRDLAGLRYGDFMPQVPDYEDSEEGSWFGWGQSFHTRTKLQERRDKAPEYSFTDFPFSMVRKRGADSDPLALDCVSDPLALDCVLGLGPSVRFGVSPLEFVDFILGWTTLDLIEDDLTPDHGTEDAEEDAPEPASSEETHTHVVEETHTHVVVE